MLKGIQKFKMCTNYQYILFVNHFSVDAVKGNGDRQLLLALRNIETGEKKIIL